MEIGQQFMMHKAPCRYVGRRPAFADGSGPVLDYIAVLDTLAPDGKPCELPFVPGEWTSLTRAIEDHERHMFVEMIPESILPHLTEADIDREYRHHYGNL